MGLTMIRKISGGAKKTFPSLRSQISETESLIAFKFGSLIAEYVLYDCTKLQFNHLWNEFLVRTFQSYVKNDNIKITAKSLRFHTCWLLHFCLLLAELMNPKVILWSKIRLLVLYLTPKQGFWEKCAFGSWLADVNMTSSSLWWSWAIFPISVHCSF